MDGCLFWAPTLRCLDQIYAPRNSRNFPFFVSSTILPGSALSDHDPVLAILKAGEQNNRPSRHRMNTSHLVHPAFKNSLRLLLEHYLALGAQQNWEAETTLMRCIKGARRADRCWGNAEPKRRNKGKKIFKPRLIELRLH